MDAEPRWLALNGQRYAQTVASTSIAADVVLVFDAALLPERSVIGRLQQRANARSSGPFRGVVELADGIDMVLAAGPGSPTASVTMELLAAFGVQRVISVGTAAATSLETSDGDICVISEATLASATSPYDADSASDRSLFEALQQQVDVTVPAITTLWPFRVDAAEVEATPGAVIEMEAATLHAVGRTAGLAIESVVVISDRYDAREWRLGDPARTGQGLERAVALAVSVLAETR